MDILESQVDGAGLTRVIRRQSAAFMEALHLVLSAPAPLAAGQVHPVVTDFLADAAARSLVIDPVVATFEEGRMTAAAAAVKSPGSTALVLVPTEIVDPAMIACHQAGVREVCRRLRGPSIRLTELLLPVADKRWEAVARQAGLHFLTDLVYFVRPAECPAGPPEVRQDVTWVPSAPENEALFERTLTRTYEGSADCPELCGLRSAAEVLAGHRSAGRFDPALWSVALHRDRPVGLLLLACLPQYGALELVYMGVTANARRRGFADVLLRRAVNTIQERSDRLMALAMDVRNRPARRVYERWGFEERDRRSVWIVNS